MYYVRRKIKKGKLSGIGNVYGLEINNRKNGAIKIKKMIIVDTAMANHYSKEQLDKRFKKLYNFIYKFLISEDNSEDGVKACLGEIEKVKSEIFNKYKEFLKNKQYREYLAKIVLTENEFRNKYLEREYFANMIKNIRNIQMPDMYDDEMRTGKSR